MTEPALLLKKLAEIESYLRELAELGRPDRMETELRDRRFIEHTLQLAIQSALDVASHIVSSERYGEPETNQELFRLLAEKGWVPAELTERLTNMAGFRNLLVHNYGAVDLGIVRDIVENRVGDLLDFVDVVRQRLAEA